jgi:MATE family multidrug resistance protein
VIGGRAGATSGPAAPTILSGMSTPPSQPDTFAEPGAEAGVVASQDATAHEPTLAEIEAHPLKEILTIAFPTVVTMTSYTVMQFIDALMVKSIGPEPVYVAAQGNGGILAWLLMSLFIGLNTIVNTYVSQNLGAGKAREGAAYAWNALWISLGSFVLVLLPVAALAPFIFGLAGHDERLLELETQYAQIMLLGGFFTVGSRSVGHYFFGIHRPQVVMISALIGVMVNIVANYVLIFGHFGVPALGVAGAAIGTVIGAFIEFVIPMAVFLGPKFNAKYGTRAPWRYSGRHVKDIVRIGWPGAFMFFNEMLCWAYLMSVLIPKAGEAAGDDPVLHNTAGWIGLRYMHLSFMPAVGLSIATTAIVGKCMGMKRPDLAASRAWLCMKVALAYMGVCALAFFIFREPMIRLFIDEGTPPETVEELVRIGAVVMVAAAVFQVFDAMAIVMSGALRGAGDTVWPGVATIVLSWTCIVGLGHLLLEVAPGMGSAGPWTGAAAFIILLGTVLTVRFLSGKWKSIKLIDEGRSGEAPADKGTSCERPFDEDKA